VDQGLTGIPIEREGRLMRLSVVFLAAMLLAGCQSSEATPDSTPAAPAAAPVATGDQSSPLQVRIINAEDLRVGNWQFGIKDLPAVLQHCGANSVVISGEGISDFEEALKVEKAVKAAGIQDVTIAGLR
jgi:biopolymer transport protein ExbD